MKASLWGIVFSLLVGSIPALAQANSAEDFDGALRKASEKEMFIVLDISTST